MIGDICLTMDAHLKSVYEKIQRDYPNECKRCGLDEKRFLGAVESYIKANNKPVDFVPEEKTLLNHLEKMLNMEGKSFFNEVPTITYTPTGKNAQVYRIFGSKIFNKEDKEVFSEDSKDRRKIFANFAISQGRAVVVEHKGNKYVVNNRNQIISVRTGDMMQWGEENGDRKEILRLSQIAFSEKQKAETTTVNSNGAVEGSNTVGLKTGLENSNNNSNFAQSNNNNNGTDREILSQRFSQEELRGSSGRLEEAEAYLQRGSYSSVPEAQTEKTGNKELGKQQEIALESWAKEKGIWVDNTTELLTNRYGDPFAAEGEAVVFLSSDGKTLVKEIGLNYYIEPQLLLDRVVLHNALFSETPLTLSKFGRNANGEFVIVATQPFVKGDSVTQEEIVDFMGKLGFKPYGGRNTEFINEEKGLLINDLHDENVIKTQNGHLAVIDGDFRLNTANYGLGGTRITKPSTSSSPSNAPSNSLAEKSLGFTLTPAEIEAAKRKQEAENKPIEKQPESVAYESALNVKKDRNTDFRNTFTPRQIQDRGAMMSNEFSDILDEAIADEIDRQLEIISRKEVTEKDKDYAKELINRLKDPVKGRQLMAEKEGVEKLMQTLKERLEGYAQEAKPELKKAWENTLEYFDELFYTQATLDIEEKEGIRIVGDKISNKTVAEEEAEENEEGDDESGNIASGSDGWSYKVRYEDPFDTMSKKVRSMLYDIKRPQGQTDDLGQQKRYPMGQIYGSLLSYLSNHMQNPDDFLQVYKSREDIPDGISSDIYESEEGFESDYPNGFPVFPVLEQMKTVYPWVGQVIQRLTDDYLNPELNSSLRYPSTGGTMASQLYTVFRKPFIPYAKIQLGGTVDAVTPLNFQMEDRVQLDKLSANYNNRMILTDTSVYDSQGKINKENAAALRGMINDAITSIDRDDYGYLVSIIGTNEATDAEENKYNEFIDSARKILNSFGIDATQSTVAIYLTMKEDGSALKDILKDLEYVLDLIDKIEDDKLDATNYLLDLRNPYGEKVWEHFFDNRGMITDASYMQSFYDSASHKTKYSYSADNYLMKTFRGLAMGSKEARRAFIMEKYGNYDWFRNQRTGEWRNAWLKYWYDYEDEVAEIPYRNIDNITERNTDGSVIVRPYMKWEYDDIWQIQDRSYGAASKKSTGYYLAPIFSDSPMSMTVRGPKFDMNHLLLGYDENGKHHYGALVDVIFQEMSRIKLVQQRAKEIENGTIKPIANFDGNRGLSFCFFPELQKYAFDDGKTFIEKMMSLKTSRELEEAAIQALQDILDERAEAYMRENEKHYQGVNSDEFREQYYNMVYGNIAITQLTTVDLAFYKDEIDFQKRFKEVYAGGMQLNTNSKYGKKTENVILLADDIITSPSYSSIATIIDGNPNLTQEEKDSIKGIYMDINVGDAQAFRSMHSFRSVLDMMGRWDERMENALNNFQQNNWKKEDFDVVFQTIKPFAYAVIERNSGEGNQILVPQQHKNSEICALMMYNLISNGLNNSPVYKALSRFMETAKDSRGEYLVDMIQFESAGKVGNQGVVNISLNPEKVVALIENGTAINGTQLTFGTAYKNGKYIENTVENATENYKSIKEDLDNNLKKENISQEEYKNIMQSLRPTEDEIISMLEKYCLVKTSEGIAGINPEVVHTMPFDCYYLQQPTPEHHVDAKATYGSQVRNLTPADLPANFELTLEGKEGKDKKKKTLKGNKEVVDFMYELLNENLIEDFFGITNKDGKKVKRGLKDVFSSKENFKEAIEEMVRNNPKYGRDFAEAMQLDGDGDFTLSPNSPTMFNLMQELVTSLFKNRITKQKINGAALIQAAGIGLDENLRLLIEDGKVKGAECYMPLTSKRFFEPLLEERIINGEKVMYLDPKKLKEAGLDKAIGYRIPSENKSSMMPLIIKGFTPLQNGSAIVLPAEITSISGSDFDVDKMYLMLSSFRIQDTDMRAARKAYAEEQATDRNIWSMFTNSELAQDILAADTEDFYDWLKKNKDRFLLDKPIIRKIEYDFSKSPKENGRQARNNMLIQMTYNILTSKEGSQSLLNPQGFPDVAKAAKVNRIIDNPALFMLWVNQFETEEEAVDALLKEKTKKLAKFIQEFSPAESPSYPQTFAHSHARNMAGAIQIGIYAIQASMAAKYQRADIRLKEDMQYSINGRKIVDVDKSDNGRRVKNVGQLVGASADNGKDPNLADMGSTSKTAPMIGYLLRCGLSHMEATLIINQPVMIENGYKAYNFPKNIMEIPIKDVDTKTLIKGITDKTALSTQDRDSIMGICYRVLKQAEAMEYITQVSRADSPNGSLQNSYAKGRIQQYRVDLLQAKMQEDFPFYPIKETLSNEAIDVTASEDVVRGQLKQQPMAFLHGMYALGINSFSSLVSPYFFGAQKWFDEGIVKPILYNLNEKMPADNMVDIINKVYNSYITFVLSDSELFGSEPNETMAQKRKRYLESFPREYQQILRDNPEIRDMFGSILQVNQLGNRMRVVLQDVGSISKGQKQDIKLRFEDLSYSPEQVKQDLAKKLLIYSYFDNGLQFTHDSFSSMFTTGFLKNFPVFNDTLKKLDEEISPVKQKRFIDQFMATYNNAAFPVDKIVGTCRDAVIASDVCIEFDFNMGAAGKRALKMLTSPAMTRNKKSEGYKLFPYIKYNETVYALEENYSSSNPRYYALPRYSTFSRLPLFNINMSIEEMAKAFPANPEVMNQTQAKEDVAPHDDSFERSMDTRDWEDPVFEEEYYAESQSKEEKYTNEGKDETQQPLC